MKNLAKSRQFLIQELAALRQRIGQLEQVESEWKEEKERLRKNEARFRSYFNMPLFGVAITSPEKEWIQVNDRICSIMGYSRDEIVRMTWTEITHPDDLAADLEQFGRVLSGQIDHYSMDKRFIRKDGKAFWASLSVGCVRKPDGSVDHIVAVVEDITSSRLAENALRENEETMHYIIKHDPNAIAVYDIDLHYIAASDRYLQDYNVKAEDIIRKHHYEVFPEMPQKWKDVHQRCLAGAIERNDDDYFERVDGSITYNRWECRPWYRASGEIGGIITYTEVTTEKKKAEKALRESEERLRDLIFTIADWVWEVDENGVYTYSSQKGLDLLGEPPEYIVGKTPFDFMPPDESKRVAAIFSDIAAKKAPIRDLENWNVRSNGEEICLLTNGLPILDEEGNLKGYRGVDKDITEKKRAGKKLAESHNLLENLARQVPGVVYQYRLYPDGRSAFPYSSPGMNDIYEVTPEDVREDATPVFGRLHPDDFDRVVDSIQESARTLQTFYCEFRVILPRQGLRWRWSQAHPERLVDGSILWHGIISDITERKQMEDHLQKTLESLRKAVSTTIQVMVSAVEVRDPYTAGHQVRSADLARAIATEMGLPQEKIDGIRIAGSIHDIGKLSIPAEMLSKPTKLSKIEFSLVKEHSQKGYEILKNVESPWPLAEIVYQHHERMNGSGYPRNLKGDGILMEARVVAVADVVEAMASHRPYRPALGIDAALEEIEKNRGIFYDNAVADACLRLFREKGLKFDET